MRLGNCIYVLKHDEMELSPDNAHPLDTTRSFLEALKWLYDGERVTVWCNGQKIGEMHFGDPIDDFDEIYDLQEESGTIHRVNAHPGKWYMNLPVCKA